jgi:D-apiose dehydrogenase
VSTPDKPLRFAILGAGFWARYQLAAWQEISGAECVAICDRERSKAEKLAGAFGIGAVYEDADQLFSNGSQLDFVDIITSPSTHHELVMKAARQGVGVICQKPFADDLKQAEEMTRACAEAGVPFCIHENFRWQTPMRALKEALESGVIGEIFRARLTMVSGFPVFKNQPFLGEIERFILMDVGVHVLDVARFLFGEAESVYCQTRKVHRNIAGEDIATVMIRTENGATVLNEMGYAENYLERDAFPQTFAFIEGTHGSIEMAPDYWLRITTKDGTHARRCPPPRYAWADPAYDVVHSSLVPCNEDLLRAMRGGKAETTAADNLKTFQLVEAAYQSAETNRVIAISGASGSSR